MAAPAKRGVIPYGRLNAVGVELRVRVDESGFGGPSMAGPCRAEIKPLRNVIVIPASFPDLPFSSSCGDLEDLLCLKGYSVRGAIGCAEEYFDAQFKGLCHVSFTVAPPVVLPHNYAYYGTDDTFGKDIRPAHAAYDACVAVDGDVDFSQFDDIVIIYAGGSAADGCSDDKHIWPHNWTLTEADLSLTLDGVAIDRYAMCPELMMDAEGDPAFTGIGLLCHEYLHTLGLVDLYDTDGTGSGGVGDALGGSTSIMDQGMYNNFGCVPPNLNVLELEMLGMVTPEPLSAGFHTMAPIRDGKDCYRMDTSVENEYFLFECRDEIGWDGWIGRSGLFVYHVDRSTNDAGGCPAANRWLWSMNAVNACRQHQCALLLTPAESFTPSSDPPFVSWTGEPSPLSLTGITRRDDGSVSFTVPEVMEINSVDVFQDAVILQWSTSQAGSVAVTSFVEVESDGREVASYECTPYARGRYAFVVDGLTPGTRYRFRVHFGTEGSCVSSISVTTNPAGGYPFISLPVTDRLPNGAYGSNPSLPLRVVNAVGASKVSWYWNGVGITVGGDCYYKVNGSGELKAVIEYPDGSEETIRKKIIVL